MCTERIEIVLKKVLPLEQGEYAPSRVSRKVRETQGQRRKEFLGSLLNQDLVPTFWPKSPCKCPNFAKLADKHKVHLARKHKAPKSYSSQYKHVTTHDNIPVVVGKMQAQKWPRKQQTHRKINQRSDWSDLDNDKDSQVRGKSLIYGITSDQETDTDKQAITTAPLRRPNTWPKVLTCERGKGYISSGKLDKCDERMWM